MHPFLTRKQPTEERIRPVQEIHAREIESAVAGQAMERTGQRVPGKNRNRSSRTSFSQIMHKLFERIEPVGFV
jgi:hypothetical protein